MRWIVRLFALLLFLGGIGAGFVYPKLADNAVEELGRWTAFDRGAGFVAVQADLPVLSQPLRATFDIRLSGALVKANDGAILTITGSIDGQTVLAAAVDVDDLRTRLVNPQTGELDAHVELGQVANPRSGTYTFVAGPGDVETDRLVHVELAIKAGQPPLDPYVQPAGLVVMALGFILMILSFRQPARPSNPNSQPPPPKWGRGG